MSNNEDGIPQAVEASTPSDHEKASHIDRQIRSDHFLSALVDAVNAVASPSRGMDVTLSVGGQLVTGTLAAALDYFIAIEPMFSSPENAGKGGTAEGALSSFTEVYRNPPENRNPASYIHLRNAHYVFPSGSYIPAQSAPGLWWRGKIEAVDAFSFGRMTTVKVSEAP
jgi:hypothetical protein